MSTARVHEHGHHWDNADQEYDGSKQGIWLFMVTEMMMFGALVMGYLIFKTIYPEVFLAGSKYTEVKLGTLNTGVLLFSSLTMALAIYYIRVNNRKMSLVTLATTFVCGIIFMVVKYFEYEHKLHLGLKPGFFFSMENPEPANLALYFSFYYLLTGLHGLHVFIGMGLIAWMFIRVSKGWYGPKHWTGVEGVGIFWHLVDLVWIYLFPLLYLVD